MSVSLGFQDGQLVIDLPPESMIGSWDGPPGVEPKSLDEAVADAIEHPLDYPALRQVVVSGDRVAIALDSTLSRPMDLLSPVIKVLGEIGVNPQEITVVCTGDEAGTRRESAVNALAGLNAEIHDPDDNSKLAYLATTQNGRRIYLNRWLTDADVVIPVGRLGFDPILGYRGPWSVLYPWLSDRQSRQVYRERLVDDPSGQLRPTERLDEAIEVSWLLGARFQLGVVPGRTGLVSVLAGLTESVRDAGIREIDERWSFQPDMKAQCVVVGVGETGNSSSLPDLVEALVTASRVVHQGGRIIALSRCGGPLGPSLQRLTNSTGENDAKSVLRAHNDDPDSVLGRRLARVIGWADIYLLSELDRHTVESLSMIPIDRLEDARRLARRSGSCLVINRAEWTRATARDEEL